MEDGGPPGQTHPANLAPLCRTHHRVKTHTAWHYKRLDDDSYVWTAPPATSTRHPCPATGPKSLTARHPGTAGATGMPLGLVDLSLVSTLDRSLLNHLVTAASAYGLGLV